jgi:integrase
MKKTSTPNERIKREYFIFLKEAMGRNEASIDGVAKALNRFETYTNFRDFKQFHIEQARGFKANLSAQANARTREKLSAATLHSTLGALKAFFKWLADRAGYKSRIKYADAEYFNLSDKDTRVATAHRESRAPTIEQIRHVLNLMPAQHEIEKRDRALIAFTILTGARDGAIASFKLKHIDVIAGKVEQDARDVKTKRSKTFTTYFFPVGKEIRSILVEWVNFLVEEKLWSKDDPLFPAAEVANGPNLQFRASGLSRKHWSTAAAIRQIFKRAFENAGLPYANPHSFRNTLVQLAYQLRLGPEEFKVWSQNLGHESILTSFSSYGEIGQYRQAEVMRDLALSKASSPQDQETLDEIAQLLARRKR